MNGESPASVALTCGTAERQITAFMDGELGGADAARLEEHIARCEVCASCLDQVRAVKSALPAWAAEERWVASVVEARVAAYRPERVFAGSSWHRGASTPAELEARIREGASDAGDAVRETLEQYARRVGIPFIDLGNHKAEPDALRALSADVALSNHALPMKKDGQRLWVAMRDPRDIATVDALRFASGCMVQPMLAVPDELEFALRAAYAIVGDDPPPPPTAVAAYKPSLDGGPDEDAGLSFEQIQRNYEDRVYSLLFRCVGDRETAEDLTVETFVQARREWDRVGGGPRADLWLYQVAIDLCSARYKQVPIGSPGVSPHRLRAAVDALEPPYRVVFILAQEENMTFEEIARVTRLTVPAVKVRLHRARNQLRMALESETAGAEPRTAALDGIDNASATSAQNDLRELRQIVAALVEETRGLRSEVKELRRELSVRTAPSRRMPGPAARPSLFAPPDPPSRFS